MQAEREPILNRFFYASVLSHECLEQALAFVIVNRLQNSTLSATQLTDIFCNVMMHDQDIQRSIRLDIQVISFLYRACLVGSYKYTFESKRLCLLQRNFIAT